MLPGVIAKLTLNEVAEGKSIIRKLLPVIAIEECFLEEQFLYSILQNF